MCRLKFNSKVWNEMTINENYCKYLVIFPFLHGISTQCIKSDKIILSFTQLIRNANRKVNSLNHSLVTPFFIVAIHKGKWRVSDILYTMWLKYEREKIIIQR